MRIKSSPYIGWTCLVPNVWYQRVWYQRIWYQTTNLYKMVLLSITISTVEAVLGRGPLFIQLFPHHQVRIISDNTNNFENGYQKLIYIYKIQTTRTRIIYNYHHCTRHLFPLLLSTHIIGVGWKLNWIQPWAGIIIM